MSGLDDLTAWFRKPDERQARLDQEPTYLDPVLPSELFAPAASGGTSLSLSEGSLQSLSAHTLPGSRALPEEDLPEPGAIIDKYRVEALVGVGGFAVVYRATHLLLHAPVAIKMLRPSVLKRRPALAPLLFEEARVAARINHPNVVRVNDVTHTPRITYVVIEYVEGGSLADLLRTTRRLPLKRALSIAIDVAEGLKAGLEVGIIHRDIKPANILLTRSGQAKVADLGLARVQGSQSTLDARHVVGTPGYMAPEQSLDAQRIDFRADVYSLGVTLYQALVGEPPFPTRDRKRALELHQHAAPTPPSSRVPGFSPAAEALILKMLAKQPAERHESYDALLKQLRAVAAAAP